MVLIVNSPVPVTNPATVRDVPTETHNFVVTDMEVSTVSLTPRILMSG